jgi:tripeptidyl-peptidase-1
VLGIVGLSREYPSQKDLTKFMTDYRTDGAAATFTVLKVNDGGYDPDDPGIEANLNIQYASAMTYPTPHTFYSIGDVPQWYANTGEPAAGDVYLEWYNFLDAQPKIPQTISVSYGDTEKRFLQEYAEAVCDLFGKLGTRGVSILFASGNDGDGAGDCKGKDKKVRFAPDFPASCAYGALPIICRQYTSACASRSPDCRGFIGPFVTSVGGTTSDRPEVAASISGGGFSNHFPRPAYQKDAVPAFLKTFGKRKYAGLYKCVFCCDLLQVRTILTS